MFSYMLLFDFSTGEIATTDYFIIAWMTSFFIDEVKQVKKNSQIQYSVRKLIR
jgi:hypothetical protein